ncbi:hypothetical protein JAAARDRAFT_142799, partial [Jaapia argillacea MUCL 33604]
QDSQMSWWPKQSSWETSSFNTGFWSPAAESWFQKRLKEIRDGAAKVKSAGEWATALSVCKQTPKVRHRNELIHWEYLNHIPPS